MKNYYVEAAIISVGLMIFGSFVKIASTGFAKSLTERERVVTVKGLSEREVPADKVIWPLVYKELDNDPAAIYQKMQKKNAEVLAFLKANGLTDEEITLNSPQVVDRYADSWSQRDIRDRYVATSIITVSSSQVENVRNIMQKQAELMKMGIALISGEYGSGRVQYEFTGLNQIKPAMVEEATKNARMTAEQFAKDSDSKLGKIRKASQGQFSISNRDDNTPHIKNIRVVSTIEYYIKD